jgi:hypothetical protein
LSSITLNLVRLLYAIHSTNIRLLAESIVKHIFHLSESWTLFVEKSLDYCWSVTNIQRDIASKYRKFLAALIVMKML